MNLASSGFTRRRLSHVVTIRSSNVDRIIHDHETPVRLCNYVDVYYNDRIDNRIEFQSGSALQREIDRFRLRMGDVLLTKDSETPEDIAAATLVVEDFDDVICGYHLAILRPDLSKVEPRFLFWCLRSKAIHEAFSTRAQGITRYGLTLGGIGSVEIPIPDLATQKSIADFLDRETTRIDQLIEKKQRLLILLEEKRSNTIESIVLGEEAARKEAPFPWLRFMPDHWIATPLQHLVKARGGATPSKEREDFWNGGEIPWFSPKDMKRDILFDSEDHITEEAVDASAVSLIDPGAVLIVTRGMILAHSVPVARLSVRAAINQDMKALLPTGIDGLYLLRLLQGLENVLLSFIEEAAHGTKKLRTDRLFKTPFPVPPLPEQIELTNKIGEVEASISRVIDPISRSISMLQEQRTSLITAAVTGQLDIAAWRKRDKTERRLETIEAAP